MQHCPRIPSSFPWPRLLDGAVLRGRGFDLLLRERRRELLARVRELRFELRLLLHLPGAGADGVGGVASLTQVVVEVPGVV